MIDVPKIRRDLDVALAEYEKLLELIELMAHDDTRRGVADARKLMLEARIAMLREWLRG